MRLAEFAAEQHDRDVAAAMNDADDSPPPSLFVNKYAPARYADLLSDERSNREVLSWLKSWDKAVFGKPAPPSSLPPTTDPHHRPERKILLLSGPPGLGKTTLAAIAANQAGYNVVEINASDDRSPEVLATRLQAACEMHAVFGDKRPNVVVLDECDGIANNGPVRGALEPFFVAKWPRRIRLMRF